MTLLGPSLDDRLHRRELLDDEGHDRPELEASLRHIDQVNRWLGGIGPLQEYVDEVAGGRSRLRLLDVGTGSAAVPRALVRAQTARGRRTRAVGLEPSAEVAAVAADRVRGFSRISVVRADGRALPFPDRSFDVALCTLTLHHLRDGEAVRLLREMGRVAELRVLVSDLERTRGNYLGALFLSRTLWRSNRLTRNDGPLSVRRSFTPDELEGLAREAGLRRPVVRRHLPFRLVLQARPPEGNDLLGDDHPAPRKSEDRLPRRSGVGSATTARHARGRA